MKLFEATDILSESAGIAQAAAIGLVLGIYYDLFRILRRVFRFSYASVMFQDIFYFVTASIPVCLAVSYLCGGVVRIYMVLLSLLCALLYSMTFGSLFVFGISRLIRAVKDAVVFMTKKIISFFAIKNFKIIKKS